MTTTEAAVRERAILMHAESVRSILAGVKTQTRRVVTDSTSRGNYRASCLLLNDPRTFVDGGPSPAGNPGPYLKAYVNAPEVERRHSWKSGDCDPSCLERLYPWVFVGDRLWVREKWYHPRSVMTAWGRNGPIEDGYNRDKPTLYRADGEQPREVVWRPSIHMPRWASRLTLEVTGVRVERVQEITDDDAKVEGAPAAAGYTYRDGSEVYRDSFRGRWNALNEHRGFGWDANPWVWVIEFRRLDA